MESQQYVYIRIARLGLDYASDITTYEKRYLLDRYVTNVNQF